MSEEYNVGPIPECTRTNFKTLRDAILSRDAAVIRAKEKATGKEVSLIVAINVEKDKSISMVPLAMMIEEGNPYDLFDPARPITKEK